MLINLRNALMTGKRLPYDAEVEYLQSTGTQWIDTGINADSNLSVEITMANSGSPWSNGTPAGAILNSPRARHHLNFGSGSDGMTYYFDAGDTKTASGYKPSDGVVFTVKVDAVNKTFRVESTANSLPNSVFDTGMNYWLFGRNGTTPPNLQKAKIYSAKLWNGSTLVRDYIPVRAGTVGYLYDRVSGKLFGNAGTGDFIVGPDVVPVEYIESHGTEWINTEHPIPANFWFDATMDITGTNSAYKTLLGARVDRSVNDYQFSFQGSKLLARYGNNDPQYFGTLQTGMTRIRVESGGKLYINESFEKQLGVDSPPTLNMYIFALNDNGTVSQYANYIRLYSLKCGGANEEHDFRPVRVGTDATSWEGAMMDVLTRRIYRNAGSGAFTYGNDLKYPIPAS